MEIPLLRRLKAWGDTNHEAGVREDLFILISGVRTMKTQRLVLTTVTPTHGCSIYISFWLCDGLGIDRLLTWGLWALSTSVPGDEVKDVCHLLWATYEFPRLPHSIDCKWVIAPLRVKEKEHWPPICEREDIKKCVTIYFKTVIVWNPMAFFKAYESPEIILKMFEVYAVLFSSESKILTSE